MQMKRNAGLIMQVDKSESKSGAKRLSVRLNQRLLSSWFGLWWGRGRLSSSSSSEWQCKVWHKCTITHRKANEKWFSRPCRLDWRPEATLDSPEEQRDRACVGQCWNQGRWQREKSKSRLKSCSTNANRKTWKKDTATDSLKKTKAKSKRIEKDRKREKDAKDVGRPQEEEEDEEDEWRCWTHCKVMVAQVKLERQCIVNHGPIRRGSASSKCEDTTKESKQKKKVKKHDDKSQLSKGRANALDWDASCWTKASKRWAKRWQR